VARFLWPTVYDLPGVVNCLFHVFAAARLEAGSWTSLVNHCQMIRAIQLLTIKS